MVVSQSEDGSVVCRFNVLGVSVKMEVVFRCKFLDCQSGDGSCFCSIHNVLGV